MSRLIPVKEYAESLPKPLHAETVKRLCRLGRITGARKIGKIWVVPENARIKGAGKRIENNNSGISVREFAKIHKVSPRRVYELLKAGHIEGATWSQFGWDIPPDAEYPVETW